MWSFYNTFRPIKSDGMMGYRQLLEPSGLVDLFLSALDIVHCVERQTEASAAASATFFF